MRLLKLFVLTPVAAILLAFAYANRDWVTIAFDPTGYTGLAPLPAPEYAVLLAAMAVGVVAGSVSTWIGQGWRRRTLREAQAEIARLRGELEGARASADVALVRPL